MISSYNKAVVPYSSAENESMGLKILKKKDFRYIDPIASVVGLALIAALPKGQHPKICLGAAGRLFPKTREEATRQWIPSVFQAKSMPYAVQWMCQSFDRTVNSDSREYLLFFNHAIPYMAMVHPTDSQDTEQNALMKDFWRLVIGGIEVLEDSYNYSAELKSILIPAEKVETNETKFALPLENTIGKTLTAWKFVIRGYIEKEPSEPRFERILFTNNEKNKGIPFEAKRIESKNSKKSKTNVEEKKELKIESVDENTIDFLLGDIQGKLAAFKGKLSVEDAKTLHDLKHIVNSTLNKGFVPAKLYTLSDKFRLVWTLKDMGEVTSKIQLIAKCLAEVTRESDLLVLGEFLDKKAVEIMMLVDNELDEVMTL
ncbi:MAG TPA: hypothetical protein VGP47_11370 [Parachlamydiaceae bacterium]|nr:hypothetical protein [Parachlamydiaceae bacterium]